MKTRTGLVSNSSSSSFVLICEKDAFDKAMNEVHPYIKYVVNMQSFGDQKVFGKDCKVATGTIYTDEGVYLGDYDGVVLNDRGKEIKNYDPGRNCGDEMQEAQALGEFAEVAEQLGDCFFTMEY